MRTKLHEHCINTLSRWSVWCAFICLSTFPRNLWTKKTCVESCARSKSKTPHNFWSRHVSIALWPIRFTRKLCNRSLGDSHSRILGQLHLDPTLCESLLLRITSNDFAVHISAILPAMNYQLLLNEARMINWIYSIDNRCFLYTYVWGYVLLDEYQEPVDFFCVQFSLVRQT